MARPNHYSPLIQRDLVGLLYHEAKRRKLPMTKLVDQILRKAMKDRKITLISRETHQDQLTG
jgi:hypothetical protein